MKLAFLGVGNMGSALIEGALNSEIVKAGSVTAYDVRKESLLSLKKKLGIKAASSNRDAVLKSDFIFLCVKPGQMEDLLREIKPDLAQDQCLVSIAAGVTTEMIENALAPKKMPLIRVMPNTPALVGNGMAAVTKGRYASSKQIQFAVRFFSSVGKAAVLDETLFDAVTAVSGSGPAYVFYLAESLERACRGLGFSRQASETLVRQTLLGAGVMLSKDSRSARELRRNVTSPGGTTEAALRYLEEKRWSEIFVEAVKKAAERSRDLGRA